MKMLFFYLKRTPLIVKFFAFFIGDVIRCNIKIALDVIRKDPKIQPGVIAIPLEEASALRITMLANLITMTPGTLTLDVSSDRKTLYIHAMYITDSDELRQEILDSYVKKIWEILP